MLTVVTVLLSLSHTPQAVVTPLALGSGPRALPSTLSRYCRCQVVVGTCPPNYSPGVCICITAFHCVDYLRARREGRAQGHAWMITPRAEHGRACIPHGMMDTWRSPVRLHCTLRAIISSRPSAFPSLITTQRFVFFICVCVSP